MNKSSLDHTPTNPSHYKQGRIECIDYIRSFLSKEEYEGYLRGSIAKYLHRYKYKNNLEDLEKAKVYLEWLISNTEETTTPTVGTPVRLPHQ